MPPNDSQGLKRENPNNGNHMLDLSTGTKIYVRSRLHDGDRKIRSNTPFFRPDGVLPINGLIKKKIKPVPIKKTAQSTKQPIPMEKREKRSRQ
jgi:hypothetical protein